MSHPDWHARAATQRIPHQAFIDGRHVDAASGETFDCISPIDGRVLAKVLGRPYLFTAPATVLRLLPGVLGDAESAAQDSFSAGLLDWPHYTRPVEWEGRTVPEVLQGGHHAQIDAAPGESDVIGDRELQAEQTHDGAQQALGPDDPAGAQVDLRLVAHHELVALEGAAQGVGLVDGDAEVGLALAVVEQRGDELDALGRQFLFKGSECRCVSLRDRAAGAGEGDDGGKTRLAGSETKAGTFDRSEFQIGNEPADTGTGG